MNRILLLTSCCFALAVTAAAQKPAIQPCDCNFRVDSAYLRSVPAPLNTDTVFPNKIDTSFHTDCGYLIVPENRLKKQSKLIRLPFIIVRSKNPSKKPDPVLFTSGGPGNSSLGWAQGITRSTLIETRDCIAFEQRGTKYAIPYLRNTELDSAWHEAYRKKLPIDSMTIAGVKRYKERLQKRGIDLSGYNSAETASDIADLLSLLHIDSVNLMGGSYSGGLMMTVAQKAPSRVRSMVLDSPLPMFSAIDEDEPVNFIEALKVLFRHVAADSTDKTRYADIENRFYQYFNSIIGKDFYLKVRDGATVTNIAYTKNDLLQVIVSAMLDPNRIKDVPAIITQLIAGEHAAYIQPHLERMINRYPAPDGMRMAVYCADQASYHSTERVEQLYQLYPFLRGYRINDVYKEMCDCLAIPPVDKTIKQAYYSKIPALIADGEMDAACRPLYMLQIKHYLPNSQCFLFINRGHGVAGKDFYEMTQQFIDHPYKPLDPPGPLVKRYE
jgi:pimeloyl-ACP methyl ester carboxylesterase